MAALRLQEIIVGSKDRDRETRKGRTHKRDCAQVVHFQYGRGFGNNCATQLVPYIIRIIS